ncbi:hypothetical protein [Geomesophilobacter sediminis]|uniref:Uncharacterized protein n=1 Tax=Geomesophilobacter sediminis TaxID=2798584 RepID=A0A8J7M2X3_9BACT|nr:hypothetical protein [Geomesophilobacter sediminis]MBJ6727663.1 hypothetical protein [Geomesophilobacter sediminis]
MKLILTLAYLCLLFPATAHAYSDPGSGLMLWQLAVSFVIGVMFYFRKFLGMFTRFFKKDQ